MCATTATSTPCSRNTLILYGSPRKDGACGQLLLLFTAGLDISPTVVDCYARAVAPCDDCRGCHKVTGCVKHDMDDVYEAIEQADTLVFIAPVYNRSFPAPMKALIDRLQCYWAKRFVHGVRPPIAKPKNAVVLTAAGSNRADGEHLLRQLEPALTVLHVTDTVSLHVDGTDGEVDWDAVKKKLKDIM